MNRTPGLAVIIFGLIQDLDRGSSNVLVVIANELQDGVQDLGPADRRQCIRGSRADPPVFILDRAQKGQRLANLVPAAGERVYGILTHATHAELERLYAHAEHVLGGLYLPEAVIVETDGGSTPALCYIAPFLPPAPAKAEYVARIVKPARSYGFPDWYVERLEAFLP